MKSTPNSQLIHEANLGKAVSEVYQIVEIEWVDSLEVTAGWESVEHYVQEGAMIVCTSVGYLIHEDDDILILAMSHDPSNEHVGSGLTIPQVAIKQKSVLQPVQMGLWTPEKTGIAANGVDKAATF